MKAVVLELLVRLRIQIERKKKKKKKNMVWTPKKMKRTGDGGMAGKEDQGQKN